MQGNPNHLWNSRTDDRKRHASTLYIFVLYLTWWFGSIKGPLVPFRICRTISPVSNIAPHPLRTSNIRLTARKLLAQVTGTVRGFCDSRVWDREFFRLLNPSQHFAIQDRFLRKFPRNSKNPMILTSSSFPETRDNKFRKNLRIIS